jgi:hypothetical protein
MVMIGYSAASQRHGDRIAPITATATRIAQPTCTDGMAESWSASKPPLDE